LKPAGQTDLAACIHQLATLVRGKSLIMIFSDLLTDTEPVLQSLHHLRHRGHEIILFHILDEAEVQFPFEGLVEFTDVETPDRLTLDAKGMRADYVQAIHDFREMYRRECARANVDYVPMDTSVGFDKALMEYLVQRQRRF
jgi:uncharacterized protein (DUF58 family)